MSDNASLDAIKSVLQETLDIDPSQVNLDSTIDSLGLDSLDLVELISNLEDNLNIDFGEPEGLTTIGDLVKHLDGLTGK